MRDNIAGRVIDCYNGRLVIEVVPGTILSTGTTVDIAINDINTITAQQRKFCYAIFNTKYASIMIIGIISIFLSIIKSGLKRFKRTNKSSYSKP